LNKLDRKKRQLSITESLVVFQEQLQWSLAAFKHSK
jgi:hypothetical protein